MGLAGDLVSAEEDGELFLHFLSCLERSEAVRTAHLCSVGEWSRQGIDVLQ